MLTLATRLEAINRFIGKTIAWLALAMVLITVVVVIERYLFESGSIRLQESITFMHALVFMLAAAYTLAAGDHVRVDIFYSTLSPRAQAWVDLLGSLFLLLPFCVFLLWSSWGYVAVSWDIKEASQEAGGLPYPFIPLMKSAIPVTALLLAGQGLVIGARSLTRLNVDASET